MTHEDNLLNIIDFDISKWALILFLIGLASIKVQFYHSKCHDPVCDAEEQIWIFTCCGAIILLLSILLFYWGRKSEILLIQKSGVESIEDYPVFLMVESQMQAQFEKNALKTANVKTAINELMVEAESTKLEADAKKRKELRESVNKFASKASAKIAPMFDGRRASQSNDLFSHLQDNNELNNTNNNNGGSIPGSPPPEQFTSTKRGSFFGNLPSLLTSTPEGRFGISQQQSHQQQDTSPGHQSTLHASGSSLKYDIEAGGHNILGDSIEDDSATLPGSQKHTDEFAPLVELPKSNPVTPANRRKFGRGISGDGFIISNPVENDDDDDDDNNNNSKADNKPEVSKEFRGSMTNNTIREVKRILSTVTGQMNSKSNNQPSYHSQSHHSHHSESVQTTEDNNKYVGGNGNSNGNVLPDSEVTHALNIVNQGPTAYDRLPQNEEKKIDIDNNNGNNNNNNNNNNGSNNKILNRSETSSFTKKNMTNPNGNLSVSVNRSMRAITNILGNNNNNNKPNLLNEDSVVERKMEFKAKMKTHYRKQNFHEVFLLSNPHVFYILIDVVMACNSFYLALWTTNFAIVANRGHNYRLTAAEIILSILPALFSLPFIAQAIKSSSILKAVTKLNLDVVATVVEKTENRIKVIEDLRHKLAHHLRDGQDVSKAGINGLYEKYNFQDPAGLTKSEFIEMLEGCRIHYTNQKCRTIFSALDINQDGFLSMEEFERFLFPEETRLNDQKKRKFFDAKNSKLLGGMGKKAAAKRILKFLDPNESAFKTNSISHSSHQSPPV